MYLARRVKGKPLQIYPLRGATLFDLGARFFDPSNCVLSRMGLSGPGVMAVSETRSDASLSLKLKELSDE